MMVQVKNWVEVDSTDLKPSFRKIKKAFDNAGVAIGVGIVLMVGLKDPSSVQSIKENQAIDERVNKWCDSVRLGEQGILSLCIAVPEDDCFGVHDFSTTVTPSSNAFSEIYSSNFSFVNWHHDLYSPKQKLEMLVCVQRQTRKQRNFLKECMKGWRNLFQRRRRNLFPRRGQNLE